MNFNAYKIVCSKKLRRILCDRTCMVRLGVVCLWCWNFECIVKMNEDQWMYDSIMSEEVDMNDENEDEVGVNKEEHVDCSKAFNTSQVIMWFIVI